MKNIIKSISVVIPVFNEESNIIELLEELKLKLNNKIKYEVLVVDDGSTDKTAEIVRKKIKLYHNLKLILHERNYGQSTSLLTGITNAKHDYIVTIDGDGQNDPSDILNLLKKYDSNTPFFLVIGDRKKRNDKFSRIIASRLAFLIRNIILKDKVPDTGCALKVFKKSDFLFVPFFNHIHRFLPFIFSTMGGKIISVKVSHRERTSGVSKYSNYQRALVGIYDLFGVIWLRKRTHSSILIRKIYSSTHKN
ncbi:MAG: Undecaprenyl-phosphate 4-deoxy-4-formamido-L-arabinose transferase [Alphaproteobacteria bacterium MarineAlpha9_Bin4]|nr:MAG: Undecaprenyl-phosphate 4-deoxy-4-formamido-L-arabinose transferase [Alphaproteobacteria bacterium MarineAlpha9_Bin4]|tara:strand:+ start:326 stop:1075 length:750 start_codon:yes stop_codon:yes gene_type:complete